MNDAFLVATFKPFWRYCVRWENQVGREQPAIPFYLRSRALAFARDLNDKQPGGMRFAVYRKLWCSFTVDAEPVARVSAHREGP